MGPSPRVIVGLLLGALLTTLGPVTSAHAARTIEHAPMSLKLFASRSPDGTIRLKGIAKSTDPRCLSKRAFADSLLRDGYYHNMGSALLYRRGTFGPASNPDSAIGTPPGNGWLVPSSFGRSPMVWRLTIPGDAMVTAVVGGEKYSAPARDAIGVSMGGNAGPDKLKYGTKKNGVKVICGGAEHTPEISF